jgi:hypothetical protein
VFRTGERFAGDSHPQFLHLCWSICSAVCCTYLRASSKPEPPRESYELFGEVKREELADKKKPANIPTRMRSFTYISVCSLATRCDGWGGCVSDVAGISRNSLARGFSTLEEFSAKTFQSDASHELAPPRASFPNKKLNFFGSFSPPLAFISSGDAEEFFTLLGT